MTRLVAFPVEGGEPVAVEVDEAPGHGTVRASRPGEVAETATRPFVAALGPVQAAAEGLVARLRDLPERPDEVGVAFGVKLSAAAGAIITSAGGEATFTVTLKWTQKTA